MLKCIVNTSSYRTLSLGRELSHAYLFYSNDQALNNEIALTFAESILCEKGSACGKCSSCMQFESNSHPDFYILDDKSIKVEDVAKLLDKMATLPVYSKHKVFVVLNFENVNERAQNKMLKSLEEPNPSNIFIVTSTKLDKILPTVLSRLSKVHVPTLSEHDKLSIINEYKSKNINLSSFKNFDTLTNMLTFTDNKTNNTLQAITKIFDNLNNSSSIPQIVSSLGDVDKDEFFPLMQDMFMCVIKQTNQFEKKDIASIALRFSPSVLARCLPLIDDAYKKLKSNVNFYYILDNLLFNILKEKYYATN